jgi:hypothetical protein
VSKAGKGWPGNTRGERARQGVARDTEVGGPRKVWVGTCCMPGPGLQAAASQAVQLCWVSLGRASRRVSRRLWCPVYTCSPVDGIENSSRVGSITFVCLALLVCPCSTG